MDESERRHIRESSAAFLSNHFDEQAVRRWMDDERGFDRETWKHLAALGPQSLMIPERADGLGLGLSELIVVMSEMGRRLVGLPFLSTVGSSVQLLLSARPSPQIDDVLAAIAAGDLVASLVVPTSRAGWTAQAVTTRATQDDDGSYRLVGSVPYVPDALSADLFLTAATLDNELAFFLVDGGAHGVSTEPQRTLDMTRKHGVVHLQGALGQPISTLTDPVTTLRHVHARTGVALAAECVGGAEHCLDAMVKHTMERRQFGQAIGAFQAVKHLCAEVAVDLEIATALVSDAASAGDDGEDSFEQAARTALLSATECFLKAAETWIQLCGAMGYSWEHPAHLYYRRAHTSRLILGAPHAHALAIADSLGIGTRGSVATT